MELYQNTIGVATHEIYVGDNLTAADAGVTYSVEDAVGNPVVTGTADTTATPGVYTATLGIPVTGDRTPKYLTWTYAVGGQTITTSPERIEIVRPYISLQEYNHRYPYRALSMRDFRIAEREVRRVVNAYCRQSFQLRENETKVVPGGSTNSLQLPDRLIRLVGVNSGINGYSITGSVTFDESHAWNLYTNINQGVLSPRAQDPLERTDFFRNQFYTITGDWGWRDVPEEVRDATAILINDFLDDDAVYREKYVDNIRAADWRMEFAATGNETTGNANADMMLEKFRNYRLEVI